MSKEWQVECVGLRRGDEMIKEINIAGVPPYSEGAQLQELKKVNFIFGMNGSGKTTISRYMRNPNAPEYGDCSIHWEANQIKCEVYNRDYVAENFREAGVPGIFTLGEGNIETKKKIATLAEEIKRLNEDSENLRRKLNGSDGVLGLCAEKSSLEKKYTDKFWGIKQRFDDEKSPLVSALEGFRGSKEAFKRKLLSEWTSNKVESCDRSELEKLGLQLYGDTVEKIPLLQIPDFDALAKLEADDILQKVIVGKEDVDVARLIRRLHNDNWVKQGLSYVNDCDGVCPFCQKPLEKEFEAKIAEYFDASYLSSVQYVERMCDDYKRISEEQQAKIRSVLEGSREFVEHNALSEAYEQFKTIVKKNQERLVEKKSSPNLTVSLDSTKEVSRTIIRLFEKTNDEISQYNNRIDHIQEERAEWNRKVWRHILDLLSSDIKAFLSEEKELTDSIESTQSQIQSNAELIGKKTVEQQTLEQDLTSVVPTANGINKFLATYGFTGFSLKVNETDKTYQFVRADGSPAFDSLSEGERNFVTFLYFIHSLCGNAMNGGHADDKVVVIDDPVSSLDSDVLFLVSSIVRDLFKQIYAGEGLIKQLFVLSHNTFFYKEVSYEQGISKKETSYWVITKRKNSSEIVNHRENPINSTYEMLWEEIRKANERPSDVSVVSLANTMRRIIEYYSRYFEDMNLNNLHKQFPDGERQVFKSLVSWAHAGSHSAFDDFSATPNLYSPEIVLSVFRDLFCRTGHLGHYDKMMKTTTEEKPNE